MLDRLAFDSIPNCFGFCARKMPVIVTSIKPTCWRCAETGLLSLSCPGKKTPGLPIAGDQNPPVAKTFKSVALVMGPSLTRTHEDNHSAGSSPTLPPKSTPQTSVDKEKQEEEWHVVVRGRGKNRTAWRLSQHELLDKNTDSPIPSTISEVDASASSEKTASTTQKMNEPSWQKIYKYINSLRMALRVPKLPLSCLFRS